MATRMQDLLMGGLGELRLEPVRKWIRAKVGDATVVDTRRSQLVWEPRRIVPSYAVPEADIAGELSPGGLPGLPERPVQLEEGPPVLDPSTPFSAHSTPGEALDLRTSHAELRGAAFRAADPGLAGYVVLDWSAFSEWYEEDELVVAHPHDPFHRIDCLRSSRSVRIESEGVLLARTSRATVLFETSLPPRFYVPPEDVALDLLEPTASHTFCAYKGRASYWSARIGEVVLPDIAWSYPEPLHDARPVGGLIAFFTERLDLTIDGEAQARPRTPWS